MICKRCKIDFKDGLSHPEEQLCKQCCDEVYEMD